MEFGITKQLAEVARVVREHCGLACLSYPKSTIGILRKLEAIKNKDLQFANGL
jgi:hypothetical protein